MDPAKLKVAELRAELQKRGLDTKGYKPVLVERLRKALDEESGERNEERSDSEDSSDAKSVNEKERPPRTPSRASRSSSITTPTKISTRSGPKTATTPVSSRQTPTRSHNVDKLSETLPSIPESTTIDDIEAKRDQTTPTPEEDAEKKKETPEKRKETPEKRKDTSEKRRENQDKPKEVPDKRKETVEKQKEIPDKRKETPEKQKEVTDQKKETPEKRKETLEKHKASPPENKKETREKPKDSPEKIKETTETLKKSPEKPKDGPEKIKESTETLKKSPEKPKDSPEKIKEAAENLKKSPEKPKPHIEQKKDAVEKSKSSPEKPKLSPEKPKPSPEKPKSSPEKPKPSPEKRKDASEKPKLESPARVMRNEIHPSESPKKCNEIVNQCTVKKEDTSAIREKSVEKNAQTKIEKVQDVQNEEAVKDTLHSTHSTEPQIKMEQDTSMDFHRPLEETENISQIDQNKEDEKMDEDEDGEKMVMKSEIEDCKDVEMKEESKEVEHGSNVADAGGDKDWDNKEYKEERKRKRSASPAETRHKSPVPPKVEDEPDFDSSNVLLSWYDSDLNLIINKDGYLSATPMHNDGFCYIWAGARASHGFKNGKVYYEVKIIEECQINAPEEEDPHILRIGWSVPYSSMQLGETAFSYGYNSTGKKCTNSEFTEYGQAFGKNDVIGCYLDMTLKDDVVMSYTVNGQDQGTAFTIPKEEMGDRALFPHILSKNCQFVCNFGQENPWGEPILDGYVPVGCADMKDRVAGPQRPQNKDECEIIMMCGLPGAGKTFWATRYAIENPEKMYNILGTTNLIDKMKVMGLPRKQNYQGRWEVLIDKCSRALNKLIEIASNRRRNYILDQSNVYASAQKRKMRNFTGYQRRAVVVVPTDEEYKSRSSNTEGKEVPESTILDLKANFSAPAVGDYFKGVEWVELNEEEGRKLIEKYNKEGKEAGFGQQQTTKRPRFEKSESNKDSRDSRSSRDSRDSRDHRDRRSNYSDRNRNSSWRGSSGGGGWRNDRPPNRGGQRHGGGGYGPPSGWRGRGSASSSHRSGDRRGGSGDRRTGNDRNRSGSSRQGNWGQMSGYQGSQGNWSGQGSWSGQSQGSWGQGSWTPQGQWSWKGYGSQSGYGGGQTNYQQGYGNGNWNSWNQQYYSQYWDQQQPTSGQTTTTASGQAVSKQ